MENRLQNPEFWNNPKIFHPSSEGSDEPGHTVNVLKFRTLVACQKGVDKQGRPSSSLFAILTSIL